MLAFVKNAFIGLVVMLSIVTAGTVLVPTVAHAGACSDSGSFFGLPHWWRGLGETTSNPQGKPVCNIIVTGDNNFQDVWTIVINVVDILLRLIGLVAVGFVILGGIRYIISQGNAAQLATAKTTIVRALVGLVIAISSVFILNFVAGNILKLTVNKDTYKVGGFIVTYEGIR